MDSCTTKLSETLVLKANGLDSMESCLNCKEHYVYHNVLLRILYNIN